MSDYFDRVERQIARRVERGIPRSARLPSVFGHLGTAAAVLVVIVVAGVFLLARGAARTGTPPAGPAPAAHGLTVAFAPYAVPGAQPVGVANAAISRTVRILLARLHQALPGRHLDVRWNGAHFVVHVSNPSRNTRAQILTLAATGRLEFYDWEASVLTPNGKTVASQLQSQDPTALTISQGSGTAAPGDQGAGCLPLDAALALAARQRASLTPVPMQAVGRVTGVMQAVGRVTGVAPGLQDPAAGYYVLRGAPALFGSDITHPEPSKDPNTGAPDVTFGFTPAGARKFKALTATIAHRGALVSLVGQTLNQHFAIVIDDRLISVPYVDYKQFPDGVDPNNGADMSGNFTVQSATDVAILLRYGPLPIALTAAG